MKKIIALLLAASMTFSLAACSNNVVSSDSSSLDSTSSSTDNSSEDKDSETDYSNQIIAGSITEINNDMMSGWTNGATNANIMELINGGASTVAYTNEDKFVQNMTVLAEEIQIVENDDGSKTYTFVINEGLMFSDGSAITAKDYVFAILLYASPEFNALDATSKGYEVVGFDAYLAGETDILAGLQLINDYTFSVQVDASYFPFYFEDSLVVYSPLPMEVIAPGVTIVSSEDGASFDEVFTQELIKETIANETTGYRYFPSVTCGAYVLESFDFSTQQAVLVINENYMGTYDGVMPSIEKIIFKSVDEATQFDELAAGSIDIITGINGGTSIETGLSMVDNGDISYSTYLRNGYGKVTFACNFGPTQYTEVRQAIAYCLDRTEFALEFTGGYGSVVHGYYGLAQWEYDDNAEAIAENFNTYTKDLEVAEQLLIDNGWTLNVNGDEYVKGTDLVRYKEIDGELVGLIIEWANTDGNTVSDQLARTLPEAMAEIGMQLNSTTVDWSVLLDGISQTYGQTYHMFNLATTFATTSYYWYYFSTDLESFGGTYNQSYIVDEELEAIALQMKEVEAGDTETWSALWYELQLRWNELMPELPLYSDEYFEFYSEKLENYDPTAMWSFKYEVVYSNIVGQ